MILDSPALSALVMGEPGAEQLLGRIRSAAPAGIGAPTVVESAIVLARRLNGNPIPLLTQLLAALKVEVIPFAEQHAQAAVEAFLRSGKGRHPAALNFGDCIAYATASVAEQPLLYLGNDFALTDVSPA